MSNTLFVNRPTNLEVILPPQISTELLDGIEATLYEERQNPSFKITFILLSNPPLSRLAYDNHRKRIQNLFDKLFGTPTSYGVSGLTISRKDAENADISWKDFIVNPMVLTGREFEAVRIALDTQALDAADRNRAGFIDVFFDNRQYELSKGELNALPYHSGNGKGRPGNRTIPPLEGILIKIPIASVISFTLENNG